MVLRGTSVSLERKNCLSKRGNSVVPNQENINNEHYDITAFENYDIAKKVYYIV